VSIFQLDASYPGRHNPNLAIAEFFKRLDRHGGPSSPDIWKPIFWLQPSWLRDAGRVKVRWTAIDSGPCATGRAGSMVSDARVTPGAYPLRSGANGPVSD
jgi:hypothetical protein